MEMINTIHGPMEREKLIKKEGKEEDENEIVSWIEYYLEDELVHRSVHVHLKRNIIAETIANFLE